MCANAAPVLQMEIERQPTKTIVHCTGKVNMESWTEFSVAVRALVPEGHPIRVDLSHVVQVDSTGIGTLVSVWASAKKNGCDLKYVNPHKRVEDVIRLTHLFDMFESPGHGVGSGS
ncbi:MAG: STAS domain-containing protein [Acidobacteriia bacterium]|nr:STAS domain-containing protein [Terriglobia bacterium]